MAQGQMADRWGAGPMPIQKTDLLDYCTQNDLQQGLKGFCYESLVPNPKLKLMNQMREVMRLKHCSIRTERLYCD